MLCNWCCSKDLCDEFNIMYKDGNFNNWDDIELVYINNDEDIDYYVIINMPPKNEYYNPKKTIRSNPKKLYKQINKIQKKNNIKQKLRHL